MSHSVGKKKKKPKNKIGSIYYKALYISDNFFFGRKKKMHFEIQRKKKNTPHATVLTASLKRLIE